MSLYQKSRVRAAYWMFALIGLESIAQMWIRRDAGQWLTVVLAGLGVYLLARAMNQPNPVNPD